MKKLMSICIALLFVSSVIAQDRKMSEIKVSELPKGVNEYVKKSMPGSTIVRAGKIEEKGVISYVTVIESKGTKHSYRFDKDGKFLGKGDNMLRNAGAQTEPMKAPGTNVDPNKDPRQPAPAVQPGVKKGKPKRVKTVEKVEPK